MPSDQKEDVMRKPLAAGLLASTACSASRGPDQPCSRLASEQCSCRNDRRWKRSGQFELSAKPWAKPVPCF